MRLILNAMGFLLLLAALGLLLLSIVESFVFWLAFLGIGGALFAIFLFPIAVLAAPMVNALLASDAGYLLGYLQLVVAFFLLWLAGRSFDAAEARAYRRLRRKVRRKAAIH